MFQFVSMCCSVFAHGLIVNQFVAVRCTVRFQSVLQCVLLDHGSVYFTALQCVCTRPRSQSICWSLLQRVAMHWSVLQYVSMCCSALAHSLIYPLRSGTKVPFITFSSYILTKTTSHTCVCVLQYVAVCCSELQCVHCVAICFSVFIESSSYHLLTPTRMTVCVYVFVFM